MDRGELQLAGARSVVGCTHEGDAGDEQGVSCVVAEIAGQGEAGKGTVRADAAYLREDARGTTAGAIPAWPHSRGWGYGPSGGLGLALIILLLLVLMGKR